MVDNKRQNMSPKLNLYYPENTKQKNKKKNKKNKRAVNRDANKETLTKKQNKKKNKRKQKDLIDFYTFCPFFTFKLFLQIEGA